MRLGDLVLFQREGRFFAHRVVGAMQMPIDDCQLTIDDCGLPMADGRPPTRAFLVTRGDRLLRPDPPVPPDEVLGRVTLIHRGGRRIVPGLTPWRRLAAWVLSHSEVCTRILLRARKSVASFEFPVSSFHLDMMGHFRNVDEEAFSAEDHAEDC